MAKIIGHIVERERIFMETGKDVFKVVIQVTEEEWYQLVLNKQVGVIINE